MSNEMRNEARKYFKERMGPRVTELPNGKLTGSVHPEVALNWFNHCFMKLLSDWRLQMERDFERQYQPLDQLSLKELEALVERLNKIIASIKNQPGSTPTE